MHLADNASPAPADRALLTAWRLMAGLALVVALTFLGTAAVESLLPQLPDQARAGTAMRASEVGFGGVVERANTPAPVEHFHAQFNLRPGADTNSYVEGF